MTAIPCIRQVVLLVPDLDEALAQTREAFGFTTGTRDEQSMADLGFVHEVCSFNDTFVELVAPMTPDSAHGRLVEAKGAVGYMLVVQVADLKAVIGRAAELGIEPVMAEPFEGNEISQWHPKSLGTLAEFDQMATDDTWHFAPRIFDASCTDVARDIVGSRPRGPRSRGDGPDLVADPRHPPHRSHDADDAGHRAPVRPVHGRVPGPRGSRRDRD